MMDRKISITVFMIFDLFILKPHIIDPKLTPFSISNDFNTCNAQSSHNRAGSLSLLVDHSVSRVMKCCHLSDCSSLNSKRASIYRFLTLRTVSGNAQSTRTVHANTGFRRVIVRGGGGEDALAVSGDLVVPSAFPTIQVF
jgi:hypothetical protein